MILDISCKCRFIFHVNLPQNCYESKSDPRGRSTYTIHNLRLALEDRLLLHILFSSATKTSLHIRKPRGPAMAVPVSPKASPRVQSKTRRGEPVLETLPH